MASAFVSEQGPPAHQKALLLHGPGEIYTLNETYQVPQKLHSHEVLVKTATIGLNPIDWKAPYINPNHPPWQAILTL